jgi:hypothetical protein
LILGLNKLISSIDLPSGTETEEMPLISLIAFFKPVRTGSEDVETGDLVIVYSTDPTISALFYVDVEGRKGDSHSCGSIVSLSSNLRILRPLMKLVNDIV